MTFLGDMKLRILAVMGILIFRHSFDLCTVFTVEGYKIKTFLELPKIKAR